MWHVLVALADARGDVKGEVRLAALKLVTSVTCTKWYHPQLFLAGQEEPVICPVALAPRASSVPTALRSAGQSESKQMGEDGVGDEMDGGYVYMDTQALLDLLVGVLDRGVAASPAEFHVAAEGLERMLANHCIFATCEMRPVIAWLAQKLLADQWGRGRSGTRGTGCVVDGAISSEGGGNGLLSSTVVSSGGMTALSPAPETTGLASSVSNVSAMSTWPVPFSISGTASEFNRAPSQPLPTLNGDKGRAFVFEEAQDEVVLAQGYQLLSLLVGGWGSALSSGVRMQVI